MIENFGYSSTVGLILIKKKDVAKHLAGRHSQQSHAGGRSKGILLTSDSIKPKYGDDYAFGIKMENDDWDDEELAVIGYQDGDSDFINAYARASTPRELEDVIRYAPYPLSDAEVEQKISYLDRAISQAPLMEENAILYRVMDQDVLEKLSIGTVFKDKGFTSTTIRDLTSPNGKAMLDKLSHLNPFDNKPKAVMQINNGSFTQGLFVNGYLNAHTNSYASELEMLLPRNMELKYTGIESGVHMFDRLS